MITTCYESYNFLLYDAPIESTFCMCTHRRRVTVRANAYFASDFERVFKHDLPKGPGKGAVMLAILC